MIILKQNINIFLQQQGEDISSIRNQDLNSNYLPTEHIRIPVNKENVLKIWYCKTKRCR